MVDWAVALFRAIVSIVLAIPSVLSRTGAFLAKLLGFASCNAMTRAFAMFWIILPAIVATLALPGNPFRGLVATAPYRLGPALLDARVEAAAAWFVLLVSLCINRAWSENEEARRQPRNAQGATAIAEIVAESNQQVQASDVRRLPDLRAMALLGAIVVVLISPFVLLDSNGLGCATATLGCLFAGTTDRSASWMSAGVQLVVQSSTFSIIPEVYNPRILSPVEPTGAVGRLAVHLLVATLQIVAITSLWQLAQISRVMREAFEALGATAEGVAALGPRAIPRLSRELHKQLPSREDEVSAQDSAVVKNALRAFELIASLKAFPILKPIVDERGTLSESLRKDAVRALTETVRGYSGTECRTRLFRTDLQILKSLQTWCAEQKLLQEAFRTSQNKDPKTGWVMGRLTELTNILITEIERLSKR